MIPTATIVPIENEDDPAIVAKTIYSAQNDAVEVRVICPETFDYSGLKCEVHTFDGTNLVGKIREALGELSEFKLIHFLQPGAYLLPEFYNAVSVSLGHSKRDYAFVYMMNTKGATLKMLDAPSSREDFKPSQFVVRKWVIDELGMKDVDGTLEKVIREYRGIEIPATLCVQT